MLARCLVVPAVYGRPFLFSPRMPAKTAFARDTLPTNVVKDKTGRTQQHDMSSTLCLALGEV